MLVYTAAVSLWFLAVSCSYSEGAKHSKEPVKDGVESLTLTLQHAVGDGEFTERGVASVRSLKSSATSMSLSQHPLTHSQLEELKSAAVEGGVYRLRAPSKLREGLAAEQEEDATNNGEYYVSTIISACSLIRASMSDIIKVIGDGRGNVIGLSLTTLPHSPDSDCSSTTVSLSRSFNTSIILDNGSPSPAPDVQNYLQKEEKEERAKREGKDDRSFFQKYWVYIIIGVFVIMTLNGAGQAAGGGS